MVSFFRLVAVFFVLLSMPMGPVKGGEAVNHDIVKGMTISCPTWGKEWASDDMLGTLDTLAELGVNWIAIHPYASISASGNLRWRSLDPSPSWVSKPIEEAHKRGIKVMIKPHIAYWGSPFSWRGDIRFEGKEQRATFFKDYERWIAQLAVASKGADAFVVGTELEGTVHHEKLWRQIILKARGNFVGPLTYAANWDSYSKVPFWDALDVIGIQAYFPVGFEGQTPAYEELLSRWKGISEPLLALSQKTGKKVLFTELGYSQSESAAHKPWEGGHVEVESAQALQSTCLKAALDYVNSESWIVGAFLWKWFPGEVQRGDFRMSEPRVQRIIQAAWYPG